MKEAKNQKATPGFNAATGTSSEGFSRGSSKYAGNQHAGVTNPDALVHTGRGPTKGNQDYDAGQGKHREPPTRGLPAVNPGKEMFTGREQVRTPGGTRPWAPAAGQNYKGNADSMNFGRGPTKGNQQ
jgi:hypothetical protein